MKFFLTETKTYIGYKVVAYNGKRAVSIYNMDKEISLNIGGYEIDPKGLYLGTSRKFCINYYTGLSDDYEEGIGGYQDMLLTYEYSIDDLLEGFPDDSDGEVKVKKAKLVNKEILPGI